MSAPNPPRSSGILLPLVRIVLLSIIGFFVLTAGLLGCFQRKLIYFPSAYQPILIEHLDSNVAKIEFDAKCGKQTAFYYTAAGQKKEPDELWVLFGGNGSTALGWLDWVEAYPDKQTAFYLIDYPGYGLCNGAPTREAIRDATDSAMKALAEHLGEEPEALGKRINILGHSLGAAAALELAARTEPQRVVLISPFTSLKAMATRAVGWPLNQLVLDRYDNADRLAELMQHDPRPKVSIIHGGNDEIIPVKMGRALSSKYPDWVAYSEIDKGDHNFILESGKQQIFGAMQ